jgi:hypothetical protein
MVMGRFKFTTERILNQSADIMLKYFLSFYSFNITEITNYFKDNKKMKLILRPLSEIFITILYKN